MPRFFRFKVQLQGIKPPMWRRFLLPASASFADLHQATQDSFGWEDCHLYTFLQAGGRRTELPSSATRGGEANWSATPLDSWFREREKSRRKCLYWYDFGDDWMHEVELEGIEERVGKSERELLAGARACPPEDCGGISGYERCVEVLQRARSLSVGAKGADAEDADLLDWLGDWEPERFELEVERRRFEAPPAREPRVVELGAMEDDDLGHGITFSPLPGVSPRPRSGETVQLDRHLLRIVMAGSVHAPGETITTGLKCIRRPDRRQCTGYITVTRRGSGDEIEWRCTVCSDGGIASGWRGGDLDFGDEAEAYLLDRGEELSVRIPADVYAALLDERNIAISPGRLLCSAQASAGQVVLRGDLDEIEELYEKVCVDENHAPPGVFLKRLDAAGEAIAATLAGAGAGLAEDDEELDLVIEATEGLALTQQELDALRKMCQGTWGFFSGLGDVAAVEMAGAVRELGEALVLRRKIGEALAVRRVEYRELSFFLGLLECTLERVEEFGTRHPGTGLGLCLDFLIGIGEIAERVHTDENELADFAGSVVQGALEMAEKLDQPEEARRSLFGNLLDLLAEDRCCTFHFAPDLLVDLKLGKRERKWLRGEIEKRLGAPGVANRGELAELRDRLD